MTFQPRFTITIPIARDLMKIEGARHVVDVLPLPPDVGLRLRQEARQRSTHHSTRIEGNRLQETAVAHAVANPKSHRSPDEVEVRNYWRALEWIEIQSEKGIRVTEDTIQTLHAIILPPTRGRTPRKSPYRRQEVGVIEKSRDIYEYMAPEPKDVPPLMKDLAEWAESAHARELPAPIHAAILAYQFVTIHPFLDGNGRTARALATLDLWKSGYSLRGFLSMEEYYTRNITAYYANLQMGLPANYYEGRNDPDLTPWIGYFCSVLGEAADTVAQKAARLFRVSHKEPVVPWGTLSRLQQQILSRCITLAMENRSPLAFKPEEVAHWFGVSRKTAGEWLQKWGKSDFLCPASGERRIRLWKLNPEWDALVKKVAQQANKEPDKTP